jgi:hypothetical protein
VSQRRLHRLARRRALAYGKEYYLVVRRLQEPLVWNVDPATWTAFSREALPMPAQVVRRSIDGQEEPLRGVRFVDVSRWLLRDIAAAGPLVQGSYIAPFSGDVRSMTPTGGLPTWASVPSVLVDEVEIRPGDPMSSQKPLIRPVVLKRDEP